MQNGVILLKGMSKSCTFLFYRFLADADIIHVMLDTNNPCLPIDVNESTGLEKPQGILQIINYEINKSYQVRFARPSPKIPPEKIQNHAPKRRNHEGSYL